MASSRHQSQSPIDGSSVEATFQLQGVPDPSRQSQFIELCSFLTPSVRHVSLHGLELKLTFSDDLYPDIVALADDVQSLAQDFCGHSCSTEPAIVAEGGTFVSSEDPWQALLDLKLVHPVSDGICYLSGDMLEITRCIDAFAGNIGSSLGAEEFSYGSLLPAGSLTECGYASNFPHQSMFAVVAHRSLDSLRSISLGRPGFEKSCVVAFHLAPTVCYHTFKQLSGSTLDGNRAFTASSVCHRFENIRAERLKRLHIFHMREIVLIGTSSYVESMRTDILHHCIRLMEKLSVRYRVVVATDGFFGPAASSTVLYQQLTASKLELQLYLPFEESWLAVMSFNLHRRSVVSRFDIGPPEVVSGCFGVGLERFAYALACQRGLPLTSTLQELRKL